MQNLLINLLVLAYGAMSIVNLIAYWPTIKDLYHHKKPSANLTSYKLWTLEYAVTFFYGIAILKDPLFILITCCNLTACITIWILLKRLHRAK